jgi:hypothetical protein
MAMVEVELDDFDTVELVRELTARFRKQKRAGLSTKELKIALDEMADLSTALNVLVLPVTTIDDQAKKEVLEKYWPKYNSFQFEDRLK